ncbi:MAG: anion permease [Holophagales bacterium]|nr:anion permease [Holophagales bacterium]
MNTASGPEQTEASRASSYGPRHRIGLIAGPVIFAVMGLLPAPAGLEPAAWSTAAVGLWMATWWMSEAIPIAATSLLPLVLFPVLGVSEIRTTAAPYANPLIFLFLGGFVVALAMEQSGLHRRLALFVIARAGTSPARLVLGFMVAAAALSMWISNTATAMMMLPIGLSVIELAKHAREGYGREGPDPEGPGGESEAAGSGQATEEERAVGERFSLCLLLGIAYACSLGGMATLVGTPTNALLAAFLGETFGHEIAFAHWMAVALPLTLLGVAIVHPVLTRVVYPIRLQQIPGGRAFLDAELRALGPPSTAERRVAWVFVLTGLSWMARPLLSPYLPGLSDAGIAMAAALVLFAVPVDWRRGCFVLDWQATSRLPWGVLLLFGGGLSLASAINATGLAEAIGQSLTGLGALPLPVLTLAVVALVVFLTELTSNTATAAAFLPVLASIAIGLGRDPLLLLIPATLAASCAFMLPVATPPNAIIYGSGRVSVPQMVRAGLRLNLIFVFLITLVVYFLLPLLLGVELEGLPPWASGGLE